MAGLRAGEFWHGSRQLHYLHLMEELGDRAYELTRDGGDPPRPEVSRIVEEMQTYTRKAKYHMERQAEFKRELKRLRP